LSIEKGSLQALLFNFTSRTHDQLKVTSYSRLFGTNIRFASPSITAFSYRRRFLYWFGEMSRLRGKAWTSFEKQIYGDWKKVGKKLVVVNGADHSRLYPPKGAGKDEKLGWRIDYGSVARDDPDKLKVVLQINSNAKSSALQEALKEAPRGSHTIFSSATIDTTQTEEEKFKDMMEQLGTGLEEYDEK